MSFEGNGFGVDAFLKSLQTRGENPLGGKHGDPDRFAVIAQKKEERYAAMAKSVERERGYLKKYWDIASEKGISRGGVYQIKGENFEVSGIELRGGRYPTVILHGGRSGFEPKEIKLDDPFWENNTPVVPTQDTK